MANYTHIGNFRSWCQKSIPLVYDDSDSYYELLCKVIAKLNEVIESQNNLLDDQAELRELFRQLKQYVDDYFNNLDVQTEINNKLDELVKDGTLADLINNVLLTEINDKVDNIQEQVNNLIIESGNTDQEVVNARTDALSNTYQTLKARIDSESSGLTPKNLTLYNVFTNSNISYSNQITLNRGHYIEYQTVKGNTDLKQVGVFSTLLKSQSEFLLYPDLIANDNTQRVIILIKSMNRCELQIGISPIQGNWNIFYNIGNYVLDSLNDYTLYLTIDLTQQGLQDFYQNQEEKRVSIWWRMASREEETPDNQIITQNYFGTFVGNLAWKYASRSDFSLYARFSELSETAKYTNSTIERFGDWQIVRGQGNVPIYTNYNFKIDDNSRAYLSYELNGVSYWALYFYKKITSNRNDLKDRLLYCNIQDLNISDIINNESNFRFIISKTPDWGGTSDSIPLNYYVQNSQSFIINFNDILDSRYENYNGDIYLNIGFTRGFNATDINDTLYSTYASISVVAGLASNDSSVIADSLKNFNKSDYYTKTEIDNLIEIKTDDIIRCWGDSLTQQGGWTDILANLSGKDLVNYGVGGENVYTIMARQGSNALLINNITIPPNPKPIELASYNNPFKGYLSATDPIRPILQGEGNINPVYINGISGNLKWTGIDWNDTSGTWTFTREIAGDEIVINRETPIVTSSDINGNNGIIILFVGRNDNPNTEEKQNAQILKIKQMISYTRVIHNKIIIMGLPNGNENTMKYLDDELNNLYGRRYIQLRRYLSHPIYDDDGTTIISSYGLSDANLTPTQEDLTAISIGETPPQLFTDGVHFTQACKTVIGNYVYKQMRDLNLL